MSRAGLTIRHAVPPDWELVMAIMVDWWGGRDLRDMLPRVFFEHFGSTSLVAEHDDELVGFLVGFVCADHPGEAYVHFGADLYGRFFALARRRGCTVVRAVTAPVNAASVAFHRSLGFRVLPGDDEVDGLPVSAAPGPYGEFLVRFERRLDEEERGA